MGSYGFDKRYIDNIIAIFSSKALAAEYIKDAKEPTGGFCTDSCIPPDTKYKDVMIRKFKHPHNPVVKRRWAIDGNIVKTFKPARLYFDYATLADSPGRPHPRYRKSSLLYKYSESGYIVYIIGTQTKGEK